MIEFVLNDRFISTDAPAGGTLLDFVRYRENLKGTKIGCREGDCGACNVLVGELVSGRLVYRTMTSCLMPLANAHRKHIVTIEGINPPDGGLNPAQRAIVKENGTQCGFCTVGFVVSLTGFLLCDEPKTAAAAVSSMDGNICRCTGYKSLERAAAALANGSFEAEDVVPFCFGGVREQLESIPKAAGSEPRAATIVGGGTDLYVQRPESIAEERAHHVLFEERLRGIEADREKVAIGASATVSDLLESAALHEEFPRLYKHLKLVSSTPIRNMATLAGNFVNASPIGDMTIFFLALDAELGITQPDGEGVRTLRLRELYKGYKDLAIGPGEMITSVSFRRGFTHFNFEKVSKRTYLDIATVNTAVSLKASEDEAAGPLLETVHISAGGVAPVPKYLAKTSGFLSGRILDRSAIEQAVEIADGEISPISDVRGSEEYKRLLLGRLLWSHFSEMFGAEMLDGRA